MVFAEGTTSNTTSNTDSKAISLPAFSKTNKVLDVPLTGGLLEFYNAIDYFTDVVRIGCMLFAFLMIIFNSFKLWSGTIEVKKAYVDMIYKGVLCIALFALYKPITNNCLILASTLGAKCTSAYKKIETVYTNAYKKLFDCVDIGINNLKQTLLERAFTDKNDHKYLTEDAIKRLVDAGDTKENVLKWAETNGITFVHEEYYINSSTNHGYYIHKDESGGTSRKSKNDNNHGMGEDKRVKSDKLYDMNGKEIDAEFVYTGNISLFDMINSRQNDTWWKKSMYDEKMQKKYIQKIQALSQVLAGDTIQLSDGSDDSTSTTTSKDSKDSSESSNMSINDLKNIFYSPWLKNTNGKDTFFISPNAILKTCVVMSDAVAYGTQLDLDTDTSKMDETKLNPKGVWTFSGLIKAVTGYVYKFGMVICCVIIMGEYTLTILEFFLLRAVGTLLIPLLFLDSTKSYAQNLLKLLFSYFFKVLMIVLTCFFTLGLYMDVITFIQTNLDANISLTLVLYLSTLVTGLLISLNAGKLASSLISGQPAMGVGDIAHIGHSMGHMAHSMGHAAQTAGHMAQGAAHMGQGAMRGAMGAAATLDAAGNAASMTKNNLEKSKASGLYSGNDKDIEKASRGAYWSTIGNAVGQKIGDKFAKGFTGNERQHIDENGKNNGFLKVGQEFYDGQRMRKATFADVKEAANSSAERNAQKAFDKTGAVHNRATDQDYSSGGNNGDNHHTSAQNELSAKIKGIQDEHS